MHQLIKYNKNVVKNIKHKQSLILLKIELFSNFLLFSLPVNRLTNKNKKSSY